MMAEMKRAVRCGGKPVTVIVLAGGSGRRMNADKARLPVQGETLLDRVLRQVGPHFDEVLISVSPGQVVKIGKPKATPTCPPTRQAIEFFTSPAECQKSREPEPKIVEDEKRGQGPMAGILAGLKAARNDVCAVVACDSPDIDMSFLRRLVRALEGAEIAVPVTSAAQFEPLFAVYAKTAVPRIEELLQGGERSLLPLFARCRTVCVPLGSANRLHNLNTRRDYEDYLQSLSMGKNKKGATCGGRTGRKRGT
jgi:molybdopterin-guanine dinucleotide biosynthesis protein A